MRCKMAQLINISKNNTGQTTKNKSIGDEV